MKIPNKFNRMGVDKTQEPLRLTATQNNSSVKLIKTGSPTVEGLKYRLKNSYTWTIYTIDTVINLDSGDYVEFYNTEYGLSRSYNDYVQFVLTGAISASGNVNSLSKFEKNVGYYRFNHLFYNCDALITAPDLPSNIVSYGSYANMFQGCTSLTTAPSLPAVSVGTQGYYQMFQGCTSLVNAPNLPATTIDNSSYARMFYGCTALTTAPSLPATSLAINCYMYMFYGCTALVNAPALSATTVYNQAYSAMFQGCTSLVNAPQLPATTLATDCYSRMFQGCTALTTAPSLPATSLANNCYYSMFQGCTALTAGPIICAETLATNSMVTMFSGCSNLESVVVKFSDWGDSSATANWMQNVSSSGTFIKHSALADVRGASNIPTNWNVGTSVSYIESTGTQFIDTGTKPDFANGDEIYISFYGAEYPGSSPASFGSRQSDLRNGVYGLGGNVTVLDADGYSSYDFDLIGNRWVKMDDSKVTSNGRNYEYTLTRKPTCTYNIYLFALNNGGNTYGIYSGMKLYEWKYYQDEVLKQNFIPVIDNNNEACMYDTVTNTFYHNSGSGDFIYG